VRDVLTVTGIPSGGIGDGASVVRDWLTLLVLLLLVVLAGHCKAAA
jgi:hypothetical protein